MSDKDKNTSGAAKKTASASAPKAAEATKARDNATAPGVDAPEPHEAANATASTDAPGVASSEEVEAQREAEQKDQMKSAEERGEGGAATPAEKGQQTRAAKDVVQQAEADAQARLDAQNGEGGDESPETKASQEQANLDEADDEDPVQRQRHEWAEAQNPAQEEVSEKDALLLAAAPGGQRTALTDGKEGSTTVTHTAASPRPPLSGPLHAPVNDIENLGATEDDPDNRVYADEAGPRDVFDDLEGTKARYVDADGNALSYDDIFDDEGGKTFVTSKVRVYEVFRFPNTVVDGRRLAYAAGRRVPRGEAENVRNQISVHSPIM